MKIAVLITCHNRAETTLRNLRMLVPALDAVPGLRAEYFLVDDGSTDGTGELIRREWPRVRVVQGSGDLYWAGGMSLAYSAARRHPESFDTYLLFNDDVTVRAASVASCLAKYTELNCSGPSLLIGCCTSPTTGNPTYGGWIRVSKVKVLGFVQVFGPDGRDVDTFNGNFVLVPAPIFDALGGLDGRYRHAFADLDLGLRAKGLGARIVVHEIPVGTCERGSSVFDRAARQDFRAAWRTVVTGPTGLRPFMRFARRHGVRGLLPVYFCHEFATRLRIVIGRGCGARRKSRRVEAGTRSAACSRAR